jgi:hypothetical protein
MPSRRPVPPAPFAALEAYILSDFMTTFYLIRQLTTGLTSHVEKVSLAPRE